MIASIKTIIKKLNSLVSINESNKEINGAIYIQKINYFLKNKIFNHKNTYKFKMPSERSIGYLILLFEDFFNQI